LHRGERRRRALVSYARVPTFVQTLNLQHGALKAAGCGQLFTDTISGGVSERSGLRSALLYLRAIPWSSGDWIGCAALPTRRQPNTRAVRDATTA
jgi:hypothetical protein